MEFDLATIFDPADTLRAVGALATSFGLLGLFSHRLDRWIACGWVALGQFIGGLVNTSEADYGTGALQAGVAAFNAYLWWTGGGEQRIQRSSGKNDS